MANIYMTQMEGIYPPTFVVMVNGKPYDYITCRDGKRLTWKQERDIIAGYQEWFDSAVDV